MLNLKQILMELGNKLVTERGYNPGWAKDYSTKPIVDFTMFINQSPPAQEVLAEMGIDWPMPNLDKE